MDKKRYLLIYHKEDNDGVFSGAIMYNYLTHRLKVAESDITAMGADYNMLATFINVNTPKKLHEQYTDIIMTDISFSDWKHMKALWDEFKNNFVWCDHHAPIIKASVEHRFDDIPGVRQTDRSAILCVWKFLYDPFDEHINDDSEQIPEVLRILSAYDSWTFDKYGYDKEFATAVNRGASDAFDLNLKEVCEYVHQMFPAGSKYEPTVEELEKKGRIISGYQNRTSANIIKGSGDLTWTLDDGKRKACALFIQGGSSSSMFTSVLGQVDNGIVFKRQPDTKWTISLYNVSDGDKFDCGTYMKKHYGGGGHIGAAGGTITEDKFIEILKKKQI